MVVNFSRLTWKEPPMLVLKNLDGTYLQPLVYAHDITAELHYNEASVLEFTIPRYVDGQETPGYQLVVGMRLIDWIGVGQFVLIDPKTTTSGELTEVKKCKAYSLEHELTFKNNYLEKGTYELWDPVRPEGTLLGILLQDYPSWSVGSYDRNVSGYRTFDTGDASLYDLMKNTLQETYRCVFDFDTYNRKINVRSLDADPARKQVYLSQGNLIKELQLEEDTENIFTALDVQGAEGVDISAVNPLGSNMIYNLDYFMNTTYFPQTLIDKWSEWKSVYESYRKPYEELASAVIMQEARLEAEDAALTQLRYEQAQNEMVQAETVEEAVQASQTFGKTAEMISSKDRVTAQNEKISDKVASLGGVQSGIDAMYDQMRKINETCALKNFFTEEEMLLLDRYIKQGSIQEDTFVYNEYPSYVTGDTALPFRRVTFSITGSSVVGTTRTIITANAGNEVYEAIGGELSLTVQGDGAGHSFSGKVIRAVVEVSQNGEYILTAFLDTGKYDDTTFPRASVTACGTGASVQSDAAADETLKGTYVSGTLTSGSSDSSYLFYSQDATEFEKRTVERDLYEYGQKKLEELAWPSYTFSVDAANFLALDDFAWFKNQLTLGERIYLDLDGKVLTPIVIGVKVDFSDPSKFKLLFGDKYSLRDSAFSLADLLNQPITMSKKVATGRFNYNAYVSSGASTQVHEFMTNALDASKNAVLSGSRQAITYDGAGLRLRKYAEGSTEQLPLYEPEQIWMINNNIVFTDDGWETAKMALGHFVSDKIDAWGLIAPNIVGNLLAGEKLIIQSTKEHGGIAEFIVDGDGARLYNSSFDLVNEFNQGGTNAQGWISLLVPIGLVGGVSTTSQPLYAYDEDGKRVGVRTTDGGYMEDLRALKTRLKNRDFTNLPNASFWFDLYGNGYFKGTVMADEGVFRGDIYAENGIFSGTVKAATYIGLNNDRMMNDKYQWTSQYLDLRNIKVGDNFEMDDQGRVTVNNITIQSGTIEDIEGLPLPEYLDDDKMDFSQMSMLLIDMTPIYSSKDMQPRGYIGTAKGMSSIADSNGDAKLVETHGVVLASDVMRDKSGKKPDEDGFVLDYETAGPYLIVTDKGVRMHAGGEGGKGTHVSLYVTDQGAYYDKFEEVEEVNHVVARFG